MKKNLLTVFYCICASSVAVAQSPISINAIPYPCTILDGPSEIKIISDHSLLMTAGKETDLHNPANGAYERHNAPKFLFTPDKNFDFSARVKPTFTKLYDGGALLIYSNRENWAKVLVEYIDDKPTLGISVIRDKITDDAYFYPEGKDVFLRVTKNNKVFNFYTSSDGTEWTLIREFIYPQPDNLKIGFYTQSPVGLGCTVEFSNIKYSGSK